MSKTVIAFSNVFLLPQSDNISMSQNILCVESQKDTCSVLIKDENALITEYIKMPKGDIKEQVMGESHEML